MDAMEYLSGRTLKMHEVYTSDISLSFCATADDSGEKLADSLRSINTIATELGFDYEIIFVAEPGDASLRGRISSLTEKLDNFYMVKQHTVNRGNAYRIGFEVSKGKYFIPFNPGVVYDIRYADLIHSFLMKREKKLFLSELPVIHRDLVSETGGFRDLSHGHDIDLYSRIAMMYGVVAYPALFNRIPMVSPPPMSEGNRPGGKGTLQGLKEMKDHIVACNFDMEDLRKLFSGDSGEEKPVGGAYLALAYAYSRLSRIKPFKFDRNNYLILMENIFESLVLKDFARYGIQDIKANMVLSGEEIRYLKNRSHVYRDVLYSISQYVIEI